MQHKHLCESFNLDEAAEFLKIHQTTLSELAIKGEIPAAKLGKRWVFLHCCLHEYLHNLVEKQTALRARTAAMAAPPQPVKSVLMRMMDKKPRKNPLPDLSRYEIIGDAVFDRVTNTRLK